MSVAIEKLSKDAYKEIIVEILDKEQIEGMVLGSERIVSRDAIAELLLPTIKAFSNVYEMFSKKMLAVEEMAEDISGLTSEYVDFASFDLNATRVMDGSKFWVEPDVADTNIIDVEKFNVGVKMLAVINQHSAKYSFMLDKKDMRNQIFRRLDNVGISAVKFNEFFEKTKGQQMDNELNSSVEELV